MEVVNKAFAFANKKHKGQRYNGMPFFVHPLMTHNILEAITDDVNLLAAALLHDTIEDTDTTYEELVIEFNSDVANLVREVTKTASNTFPNLKTQRGVMLKFADRLSNVSAMDEWDEARKQKYMFEKSKFWKS